ncbi:pyridoxamine 5'-phosphate oxidase family protein [Sphaerobacter thermophilus]|uniref:pyridoxamine 5'-phosphate oxidase family protein n=1 Tax=Sphaerobacter thermophilus TaxID=2057 RepID=UPI0039C209DB
MSERVPSARQDEPRASRPWMKGYGVPAEADGMLEWTFAVERLERARNYWVTTATPMGQPHAVPVWGAWVNGAVYFSTAPTTRTARNLAANPAVAVHLESGDEVVALEGEARPVTAMDEATFARLGDALRTKYGEEPPDSPEGFYVLRPRVAYGWTLAAFPKSVTRWQFNGAS